MNKLNDLSRPVEPIGARKVHWGIETANVERRCSCNGAERHDVNADEFVTGHSNWSVSSRQEIEPLYLELGSVGPKRGQILPMLGILA